MPRISQTVAEQIAKKMVAKKRTIESESQKEFREYVTTVAESKVPKDVMSFFKKHSEYVKATSRVRFDGKGISKLEVSMVRAIPSVSPNCYYEHIDLNDSESVQVKKMSDVHEKMSSDNYALENEIAATLISLRTYANIERELPEAAEYLPQLGLTVIVDTEGLRKRLK